LAKSPKELVFLIQKVKERQQREHCRQKIWQRRTGERWYGTCVLEWEKGNVHSRGAAMMRGC